MGWIWRRLSAVVTRHPARLLAATLAIVALLALGLPRLGFVTGEDTMVDPGSPVYRVDQRYQSTFGGEPMCVLLTGDIRAMSTAPALDDIRKAIELAPEQARYMTFYAELVRKRGEIPQAIDALTRAIALDYTDYLPFLLRGKIFLSRHLYLKAIIDLCQSLDLYPNQPQAIACRGEAGFSKVQYFAAPFHSQIDLPGNGFSSSAWTSPGGM